MTPISWGLAAAVLSAGAGDIEGTVTVVASAVGSRLPSVESALVFLEDAPGKPTPAGHFEMIQSGKAFSPQVLVVSLGSSVSFPNMDAVLHNVFSLSPGNTFDLGLHKTGDAPSVTFERPGIVSVYCNIHPQMIAYVVVMGSPFFAHPASDGRFAFKGVPEGTYHAVAWFPVGAPVRQEVTVPVSGRVNLNFALRERNDVSRHHRKDGSRYGQY